MSGRARKFYSCKIFFITRGMPAAELYNVYALYTRVLLYRPSPAFILLLAAAAAATATADRANVYDAVIHATTDYDF